MKKLLYSLPLLPVLLAACTKNISGLNNNPKSPINAPSAAVFLAGEKGLADAYTTDFWGSAPFRVIAQVWTQNSYNNEAHYQFATNNAPGGWWNNLYTTALNNLAQAKTLYATDVKDPVSLRNDLDITDILEVYTYHLLVNTYGNVPYTDALKRTVPFPKYDDAKTVVYDLIARLDTAAAGLTAGAVSLGSADQIYNGDVSKWKKFAATLKLKLALYIADTDPATAKTKAEEAATEVFQSNADNALLIYDASATGNSNPIWQDLVNGANLHYYSPSAFFVNTLKAWSDPRLPLFFTKDPEGNFTGGTAGTGNASTALSSFSEQWLSPSYPADLLDYAEAEFLLAEAIERGFNVPGTAQSHYNNAITASIEFWGGSHADALTYLTLPAVNYATASGDWKQKIGYQQWIAFANRNWDAWTSIRRLGYPDIDVVSPPVGAIGKLPLRLYYPPSEQTSNPGNWADAVSKLPGGEDVVSAKLFWKP